MLYSNPKRLILLYVLLVRNALFGPPSNPSILAPTLFADQTFQMPFSVSSLIAFVPPKLPKWLLLPPLSDRQLPASFDRHHIIPPWRNCLTPSTKLPLRTRTPTFAFRFPLGGNFRIPRARTSFVCRFRKRMPTAPATLLVPGFLRFRVLNSRRIAPPLPPSPLDL